ncbi:OmpA family protein [Rhodobacter capsulatus]|uniref:OmpA family protein n=1 Tax=Rhodobacter capsulatus TaxID=1061 RepID=UPI004029F36B
MRPFFCAAFFFAALPAQAEQLQLTLPAGASVSSERTQAATSYGLPIGPWRDDTMARSTLEGTRSDTAWRLRGNQQTTLQILAPLRDQIAAAGYILMYQCETDACGGFDFRYALDLIPEPEMHVDLSDFRYLAAQNGNDWIALTVSRSSESGFVHLTTMTAQDATPATPDNDLAAPQPSPEPDSPAGDLGQALESTGKVALDDLVFASGASKLADEDFASLSALADYLATRPEARIALVGHTDNSGSLAANVALSKDRAAAVRKRLIEKLGVPAEQLTAEGAGWLAPRTSNLTPEGREKNRRVEAVLASTPR